MAHSKHVVRGGLILALMAGGSTSAWGQATLSITPDDEGSPSTPACCSSASAKGDSFESAYQATAEQRKAIERELNKLRSTYFRSIRNVQIRQAGITKLREYTDPIAYPALVKTFRNDGDDVAMAVLDHLTDLKNDEADATLTWLAIFDDEASYREQASKRLMRRLAQANTTQPANAAEDAELVSLSITSRINSVIATGLQQSTDSQVAAAADLAANLKLAEAIPALINAQVSGSAAGVSSGSGPALAFILIGQQQAYVSDLTPVVGDSAVGFDPQLSVVTSGTLLRVGETSVTTYRTEVNRALIRLTSDLWGRPTGGMGWDVPKWRAWYTTEFKPYWSQVEQAKLAAKNPGGEQGGGPR